MEPNELKMLAQYAGGSQLYGLNTPQSDVDLRGVYIHTDPAYVVALNVGHKDVANRVTPELDYSFCELRKFLEMVRKANTQAVECLYAPETAFAVKAPLFERLIRQKRESLLDTTKFFYSTLGYMGNELRLANGERPGDEGGKRHTSIEKHGFSPKNFVQLFRLAFAGRIYLETGDFPINFKESHPKYWNYLMDIKTNPEAFNRDELNEEAGTREALLKKAFENRKINREFDLDVANRAMYELYMTELAPQWEAHKESNGYLDNVQRASGLG